MKKIVIAVLFSIITGFIATDAATVSESQARAIAGRFFNVTMPQRPAALKGRGATIPSSLDG